MKTAIITLTLITLLLLTGCSKQPTTIPGSNITSTSVQDVLLKDNCYQIVQQPLEYFKTINPLQNRLYCDKVMCCVLENNPDGKCLVANCIDVKEIK